MLISGPVRLARPVDIETLSDTVRRVLEEHGLSDIETIRQHLEVYLHLEEGELVSQSEVIEALLEDVSGIRVCPAAPGLMLPISLRPTCVDFRCNRRWTMPSTSTMVTLAM